MRIVIIGRTEILYETTLLLKKSGHEIIAVITSKEAPEYTRTSFDFENLAKTLGVPFYYGSNPDKFYDSLLKMRPDIGVSINYTGIISNKIINVFQHGILNAHGGDLPRYRGNACQAWAILNGEEKIGLCIHKMIGDELDSGDIIVRDYLTIDDNTKITVVWQWMLARIPRLMLNAIEHLQADSGYILEEQSKATENILRCYPRKPEDGRINWNASALNILRLINATNKPYAGAFCFYEEKKIIIWEATLLDDGERFCAVNGQVINIGNGYIDVACGQGKIRILLVEYESEIIVPSLLIKSIRKRLV